MTMPEWITIEVGLLLAAIIAWPVFLWSFRNLPLERWQFAAILPSPGQPHAHERWIGTNITFYGVISAAAYAVATALFIFLCGSVGQPLWATLAFIVALLAACIPASRLIAKWVEGGNVNFTVGGAAFAAALLLPFVVYLARYVATLTATTHFDAPALIAAAGLAYVLGEAIGRLGCLSFGCCYGRPISAVGALQRALYGATATTYRGQLKKISYASNLENTPVVPVQSIASVLLFTLFLVGLWLYWQQHFVASALLSVWGSQLWRLYSETLRADYRGGGKFSAYQWMAVATCVLSTVSIGSLAGDSSSHPRFAQGWASVSQLEVFIALQLLAVGIVWFMGRSQVTGALVNLRLFRDRL
jgi:Prolipoprotein diacylglyceryl transferase